ncbi:DDB1- and CUL4-associated factor 10 homolog [Gryllus bimaculatus]|nr:DDB1- and CUL4-associated factor 10 homolog [Gryllus bimaculatus]
MMHQQVNSGKRAHISFPDRLRQRELRQRVPLGNSDVYYKSLYSSILPCQGAGDGDSRSRNEHGGLFSLEFCPDGSLLVAGCEKSSFLVFDPLSRKLIRAVHNAHASCVTTVKFLNSRTFATGSVDKTVALWDTRHLKTRCRTLRRHSSAIGNIEFSRKNDLLITTALDGNIYTWDLKNWVAREELSKKTFRSYMLLRLRLNPDQSKMILSTANGFLIVIHDLDLNVFTQGRGEYQLESIAASYLHQRVGTSCRSSSFLSPKHRRNRVEMVADFPNAGACNVISALEIHPQGWSAISRSTSEGSGMGWTCVHDIQDKECSAGWADSRRSRQGAAMKHRRANGRLRRANAASCLETGSRNGDTSRATPRPRSTPPGIPEPASPESHPASSQVLGPHSSFSSRSVSSPFIRSKSSASHLHRSVNKPFSRLTHYIEEPVASEWYTENLSASADGRLICSPLGNGIRLLAFSPECSEQSGSWSEKNPSYLHELVTHVSHSNIILCTKFSPVHCLLVSGCLDGKLAWYQPVL